MFQWIENNRKRRNLERKLEIHANDLKRLLESRRDHAYPILLEATKIGLLDRASFQNIVERSVNGLEFVRDQLESWALENGFSMFNGYPFAPHVSMFKIVSSQINIFRARFQGDLDTLREPTIVRNLRSKGDEQWIN